MTTTHVQTGPPASTSETAAPAGTATRSEAPPRRRRRARRLSVSMKFGAAGLVLYLVAAVASQFWTPHDPIAVGVGPSYSPPGSDHWFGTDRLGSDIFSMTMRATGTDIVITLAAVGLSAAIGTALGTIAGYFDVVDSLIMRLLEVLEAFPTLLLAMLIVHTVGNGIPNVIMVVAVVGVPGYLRLVRAEVMGRRSWQYAEAARMVGNGSWRIAFRHLLPNSITPLLAFASINAAWVVVVVASLGFIGLGIEPGSAEWGSMISRGQQSILSGEWWISFFPGLAIMGLAGAFYLLGDGVADANDPGRR